MHLLASSQGIAPGTRDQGTPYYLSFAQCSQCILERLNKLASDWTGISERSQKSQLRIRCYAQGGHFVGRQWEKYAFIDPIR